MEWIFPCNEDSYDIHRAYNEMDSVDWVNHNHTFEVGDIVYIYIGNRVKAIRYKCVVTNPEKRYTTIDDTEYGGNPAGTVIPTVELKFIVEYPDPGITLETIRQCGVNRRFSMQSQIRVPEPLRVYIEQLEEAAFKDADDYSDIVTEELPDELKGLDREAVVKERVNQDKFRNKLIEKYGRCALCGVKQPQLLNASHIKPWRDSNEHERVNCDNGLLLCPNHDRLFDSGFISFDETGRIMISSELEEQSRIFMNVSPSMAIELSEEQNGFMDYHRNNVFIR